MFIREEWKKKEDERSSLANIEKRNICIWNLDISQEEEFEITDEKGRGGSCIVYRAFKCVNNERQRPVLLKEFYPVALTGQIQRNDDTGELFFKPVSDSDVTVFEEQRNRFLELCHWQRKRYADHPKDTDEMVEIQGVYSMADSLYVMMRASGGESWDKKDNERLDDILETVISTLHELKHVHDDSLLHGDIKPENIYIFNKTRQHVGLLDMDSMQLLKSGALTGVETLSFTENYAAPEIIAAVEQDEIDRCDYFACITPAADLYSVAAMLYEKVTGKLLPQRMSEWAQKERRSVELSSLWEREKDGRLKGLSEQVIIELGKFFDVMLSLNPDKRYSIEEMEAHLRLIMIHARPPLKRLTIEHRAPHPTEYFIGRKQELQGLARILDEGNQMVFVCGEGGVGKSEFVRQFAWLNRNTYDFLWTTFSHNLEQTIIELQTDPPFSLDEKRVQDRHIVYKWNLDCLRGYHNTAVLIIDNTDLDADGNGELFQSRAFADIRNLEIKVIFTSRSRPAKTNAMIELAPLNDTDVLKIMRTYYTDLSNEETLRKLIRVTKNNTLLAVQMAKLLEYGWGNVTPETLLESLSGGDDTDASEQVSEQIRKLFTLDILSERSKNIMACAALFPPSGVNAGIFLRCYDEAGRDRIQILEMKGWIRKTSANLLTVHPLVRDTCIHELGENMETECPAFLDHYFNEFSKLDKDEWMKQRFQRLNIASRAAELLSDPEGLLLEKAGNFNYAEGRYCQARAFYQSFWKRYLKNHPVPDTLEAMRIMDRVAGATFAMNDFIPAVYYEYFAIQIAEKEIGEENPDMFPYYMNLGNMYLECENYDLAFTFYSKADKVCKTGENKRNLVYLYKNLGTLYERLSDRENAARYISAAMDMANNDRDIPPEWQASMLETLAALHHWRGNHEKELECSREALRIYNAVYGPEHERTAVSHVNEASALKSLGRYKEARDVLLPAVKILEQTVGVDHVHTAKVCYILAEVCTLDGNFREALKWCEKGKEADTRIILPQGLSTNINRLYNQLIRKVNKLA